MVDDVCDFRRQSSSEINKQVSKFDQLKSMNTNSCLFPDTGMTKAWCSVLENKCSYFGRRLLLLALWFATVE